MPYGEPKDVFWHLNTILNCLKKCGRFDVEHFRKSVNSALHSSLQKLVHCYWDNAFTGVAETSVEIFQFYYRLFEFEPAQKLVLDYLESFPYFTRGKYRVIAKLVEFSRWEQVWCVSILVFPLFFFHNYFLAQFFSLSCLLFFQ